MINTVNSPEKAYHNFINGLPVNDEIIFDVMKYCIKVNDLTTFMDFSAKYGYVDLQIDQLIELLQLSSLTWPFAAAKIVEKEPDGSVCIPLTRYFSISQYNGSIPAQVADIIMKDPDLQSKLNAFDCINLLSMVKPMITDISPLKSLLAKFGLIDEDKITRNLFDIKKLVFNSPKINQLAKEDINGFVNIIPPYFDFIKYAIGVEVSKEFFDKIVNFVISLIPQKEQKNILRAPQEDLPTDFVKFVTHPINRKYVDIKELCKSSKNMPLIKEFEFTNEEFELLKNVNFMKDYFLFNKYNEKFFTLDEVLQCVYPETIVHSILTKPLIDGDIAKIQKFIYNENARSIFGLPRRRIEYRPIFERDEICNGVNTNTLLKFLSPQQEFDKIFIKIFDLLLSKKLDDEQKAEMFLKIPTNDEALEFILSRREKINDSCLILYSSRVRANKILLDDPGLYIVEKGTPIGDVYVEKLFRLKKDVNYKFLFKYNVSKQAMARALISSAEASNIGGLSFLISKGVPVNIILNSKTPLQAAISSRFVEGVQILLNQGASLGFKGIQTAAICAENSDDMTYMRQYQH
ncbi:hypothetical protein TVAG_391740 [Trichomonas vaginalis G3]|uniref:DUF3447 domain-containing protein n=1 Tax=Trichomonas vaginalis (strain ATCC PRA-98 / G3) TaxID=412133 RepID=A2DFT7_TRIV3|nr:ankycorbin family [Trichomonas vaginalis G3]EAY20790.1 hypothetical protein TVAG_391740 [Trichomonas vaginalis G3]KAI5529404.1 ankycorbin family [Trichomonas vaginalis G3]|eukprot:XP_001581776.1 hypothetical protein [Trichomonas vaginalis G3]